MTQTQLSSISANVNYYYSNLLELIRALIRRISVIYHRGKPITLQFPIINGCNLRCKTCNVYDEKRIDISLEQINEMVNDKLFSNVKSVGINGGEPFLVSDIDKYIAALLKLPKIKNINIISNGILTKRIIGKLKIIYTLCQENQVLLSFTTSLDGFRDVHNSIRGGKDSFDKTIATYNEIKNNMSMYCDKLGIICTISKHNIFHIYDLVSYFKVNEINNVSYQLAVINHRLHNENMPKFSVLDDKYASMMAQEFFYSKYMETNEKRYYFFYKYLVDNGYGKRMSVCNYANRDVTVDASGYLLYCATYSKRIGHIDDGEMSDIFYSKQNIEYRKQLVNDKCNSCIHYTSNNGFLNANIEANSLLRNQYSWINKYELKG